MKSELIQFGLRPLQAQVYMHLLKLKEASASEMAKYANIPRLTAYSNLEKLREMGLVNFHERRRTRVYHPNPADSFLKYCDEEMAEIQSKRSHVESLIPKLNHYLKSMEPHLATGQTYIRCIQGKSFFEDRVIGILGDAVEWYVVQEGLLDDSMEVFRRHTDLMPRFLLPQSHKNRGLSYEVDQDMIRYFSDELMKYPMNFMIIDSRLFMVIDDGNEFSVVEILHPRVTVQMKSLFWLIWERETQLAH